MPLIQWIMYNLLEPKAYSYAASGSIIISGGIPNENPSENYVGSGSILLSGTAYVPAIYFYDGQDGILLSGSAVASYLAEAVFDPSDIVIKLSGGPTNNNLAKSIGGQLSSVPATPDLFDNITNQEISTGYIDYRCVYILNQSQVFGLNTTGISIKSQVPNGAYIQIGTILQNDIQRIVITGDITGGSFSVQFQGNTSINTVNVQWEPDLQDWANGLQTQLRTIPDLQDIIVTASGSDSIVVFLIEFAGSQANRFQELMEVGANNLTGSGSISVSKSQDGSPINLIAPKISMTTAQPPGINFADTDPTSPINIGTLLPGDSLPLWIKRTTPRNVMPILMDGFVLDVEGQPFTGSF